VSTRQRLANAGRFECERYFGGKRVRSQVLDHSSRERGLVWGFHKDMHSA
jgi:hypothetical protein